MITLVTGGSGMVGCAFQEKIKLLDDHNFVFVGSRDCDLTDRGATFKLFEECQPDRVIHLAARVGGVKGNTDFVADFYSENIRMNTNVLDASYTFMVKKVVSLLSTCVYPDAAEYPLTEDQIHSGSPHWSNFGYAYAKRMLEVQSRAYRRQHGCNFITAIPNNLFGKNDNYGLEHSHVIPAIIRKMYEAKMNNENVVLWGDGTPLREFTYCEDAAEILLFLLDRYDNPEPINVGKTQVISIKEVAETIASILEFEGEIIWDINSPKGQFRKPSDNSKLLELGWREENYTPFKKGLKNVCDWFVTNYPNVRGVE